MRRLRIGLKVKLIAYAVIMTILGATILSWFVIRHERRIIQEELKKRGVSLARNLAYNSEYGVLIANEAILLKLIQGVMKEDDVVYCLIHDSEGRVLAQAGKIKHEARDGVIDKKAIETTESLIQYYLCKNNEQLYDITAPIISAGGEDGEEIVLFAEKERGIKEGKIGVARVGISFRNANALITKIRNEVFILTLIIITAYILLIVFAINAIIHPIRHLVEGTQRVGRGDLTYRVDIKRIDELGELADSFNQMTQELSKNRDELQQWGRTLEQKVEERTKELEEAKSSLEIKVRERTKELEEARNNLEIKVRERTKELERSKSALEDNAKALKESGDAILSILEDTDEAKKELEAKSKDLERSNKELDDFTYMISHDLKEPLRSIDAFSKFIDDDYKERLDEEGRNYLERIRANASRMQALIEDLLEISRIERKKNPFEEVDIEELINESKLRLEYAIKQKNTEIIIQDKLPKVFCDRVRLTEVFINLISNAIKFNDKPNPRIEIGCKEKEVFYEFCVKDNGPGIEEQYFDKIFEIFQRLGKREEYEGTGAGLTIAKKIVQMHRGKIWAESKIGEGTTFRFTLPKDKEFISGKKKIGEILVEKNLVSEEDVRKALEEQGG